jgi:hypothetical protein
MMPVVFTHRGDQDYVSVAIRQARRDNDRVVLLGDESNAGWDVEHHYISDYWTEDARRVEDYYVHMCSNPRGFELYNLQEFFVLREFVRREGLDTIFACDSDVMVYADLSREMDKFGDFLAVYSIPELQWEYRWSASAHSAYWTAEGLEAFCAFIEETYMRNLSLLEEKWRWHQREGIGGGVCDMTLLWLFYERHRDRVSDICRVIDGVTFDHNIRAAENHEPSEYTMSGELKDIAFAQDGYPYCWNLQVGEPVRFATLHFQDGAKPRMKDYVY